MGFPFKKRIDVVKLDAESSETMALLQPETLEWLSKYVDVLLMEWHPPNLEQETMKALDNLHSIGFYSFYNEYRLQPPQNLFYPVQSFVSCQK